MATETLNFKFGADSKDLESAFDGISENIEKVTKGLEGIAGAVAFDKLLDGFKDVLTAASNADLGVGKFYNTMKASGQAIDIGQYTEMAEGLSKVSTFSKDAAFSAGVVLSRFSLTQAQIESMLPSIADLAASMGVSLPQAAEQVGRSLTVGSRSLNELGIGFDKVSRQTFDAADQQTKLDMIMQRVGQTVKGTAELVANSGVGALQNMAKATEELKESLGHVIEGPAVAGFKAITDAINTATNYIDNLGENTKATLGKVATFALTLGATAAALAAVAGAVGAATLVLPALTAGFATLAAEALPVAGTMLAITAGVVGVMAGVGALRLAWDSDLGGMRTTAQTFFDWLRKQSDAMIDSVAAALTAVTGPLGALMAKSAVGLAKGAMKDTGGPDGGGQSATDKIAQGLKDAFASIKSTVLDPLTQSLRAAFGDLLGGQVKNLADSLKAGFGEGGAAVKQAIADGFKVGELELEAIPRAIHNTLLEMAQGAPVKDAQDAATRGHQENIASNFASQFSDNQEEAQKYAALFLQDMQNISGLSAEAVAHIAEVSNGNIQVINEIAQGFHDVGAATNKALQNAQAALDAAAKPGAGADAAAGALAGVNAASTLQPPNAVTKFATSIGGKLGDAGTTVNAAIQGAQVGGPIGAAAAVGVDLLSKTQSFKKLSANLTTCLQSLIGALEPLVGVVAQIVVALKPLFDLVSNVIKGVVWVIVKVLQGVAAFWNGLVDLLDNLLGWLGVNMEGSKVDFSDQTLAIDATPDDDTAKAANSAADGLNNLTDAANNASSGIINGAQGWVVSQDRYNAIVASLPGIIAAMAATAQREQAAAAAAGTGNTSAGWHIIPVVTPGLSQWLTNEANAINASHANQPAQVTAASNPVQTRAPIGGITALSAPININVSTSDPATVSKMLRVQLEKEAFLSGQSSQSMMGYYGVPRSI